MSFLFDVGGPEKKKPKKAQKQTKEPPAEKPAVPRDPFVPALGRIDGVHACLDESCCGSAFDIVEESQRELEYGRKPTAAWLIECCFCGTGQWVPVIEGHLDKAEEEESVFRFRDGRCKGMTVAEAAGSGRGLDYVRWAAEKHDRPAVRDACKMFLDTMTALPYTTPQHIGTEPISHAGTDTEARRPHLHP